MCASDSPFDTSAGFPPDPRLTPRDDAVLVAAAAARVAAAVCGAPPPPSAAALGRLAARPVYGAFVSLKRGKQLRSCCGYLGESLELAQALDHAAVRAACDDPRFPPIGRDELHQLRIEVWVLWGFRPVPQRGPARAAAVEIGRHGVQISSAEGRGLLLPGVAVEHGFDAAGFLDAVCHKAGLPARAWLDDDTKLFVFEGRSAAAPLSRFVAARTPVWAGRFYPGDRRSIDAALDRWRAVATFRPAPWLAAVVPHAGWPYSGRLAFETLAQIDFPPQTIIFCPRHTGIGPRWAVWPGAQWEVPGATIAADPMLAARLAAEIDGLMLDDAPHREEHAIEVLLPMIARLAPHTRVAGITVGMSGLEELIRFGDQLAEVVAALPQRPLLLVSSDMHHRASDMETRRLDELALKELEAADPQGLYRAVIEHGITMCGAAAAVIVLEALRRLNAAAPLHGQLAERSGPAGAAPDETAAHVPRTGSEGVIECCRVGHTTSAEASGDWGNCVGYAGLLYGPAPAAKTETSHP